MTTIREPQAGGSQALLADLAAGLTSRGYAVDVYAATGSQIPGVRVIDTGADPDRLTGSLYRANGGGPTDPRPVEAAFAAVYAAIRTLPYDVVHNHAFDAPAMRLATSLSSPVIHTLHLPPDLAMRAAVSEVQHAQPPPTIATVSAWQANAWGITTIFPNGVPIARIPWSDTRGEGVVFAGRLSPEKGAAEAIETARKAGVPIDLYGDPYDPEYAAALVSSSRAVSGVSIHSGVAREVLWRVMGRAAAVLCPAGWDEPFGLVAQLLELRPQLLEVLPLVGVAEETLHRLEQLVLLLGEVELLFQQLLHDLVFSRRRIGSVLIQRSFIGVG